MSSSSESNNSYSGMFTMIELMKNVLTANISDSLQIANNIGKSLSVLESAISVLVSDEFSRSIKESVGFFLLAIDRLSTIYVNTPAEYDNVIVDEKTFDILEETIPFIPTQSRKSVEAVVIAAKTEKRKILTRENIQWLLSLIIPILFSLCMNQSTNKSASDTSRYEKESISIQKESCELDRKEIELLSDFFDDFKQLGIDLTDQVDTLLDRVDSLDQKVDVIKDSIDATNNLVVSEGQNNHAESHGNNKSLQP